MIYMKPNNICQQPYLPQIPLILRAIFTFVAKCSRMHTEKDLYAQDNLEYQ